MRLVQIRVRRYARTNARNLEERHQHQLAHLTKLCEFTRNTPADERSASCDRCSWVLGSSSELCPQVVLFTAGPSTARDVTPWATRTSRFRRALKKKKKHYSQSNLAAPLIAANQYINFTVQNDQTHFPSVLCAQSLAQTEITNRGITMYNISGLYLLFPLITRCFIYLAFPANSPASPRIVRPVRGDGPGTNRRSQIPGTAGYERERKLQPRYVLHV